MLYIILGIIGLVIIISIYYYIKTFFSNINDVKKENIRLDKELGETERELFNKKTNLNQKINESKNQLRTKINECKNLEKRNNDLEIGMAVKDDIFESLKNKTNESISRFSTIYADQLLVQYEITARYLETKKHPAIVTASNIRILKKEAKIHKKQFREMMYKYEALLQLFPELTTYVDDFETIQLLENFENIKDLQDDFDRVSFYISKEEYKKLGKNERNQLALNRYLDGQKSNWQIGRDYELYCGREYEKKEWEVEYIGMEKKLNDMGRDLIAKKDNRIHVIQCKFWAKHKQIHEKHITQLYGTTVAYGIDKDKDLEIVPVLMTNIKLSETATRFAEKLGILVLRISLKPFPRIKCNVGKDEDGFETKIYHLPFDQQYDRTKIKGKGCFYAMTVNEASDMGFRRAYRYYGA